MLSIPVFVLPLIALGCIAAGFAFGKLHERLSWNQLVEAGILPRPRSARPRR